MKNKHSLLKKIASFFYILSAALMVSALVVNVIPPSPALAVNAGAIWTTSSTCVNPNPVDQNLYNIGDTVHIRGNGFLANTSLVWVITKPGDKAVPPFNVSGSGSTDGTGYFCLTAHTIQPDEDGEYTVDVTVGSGDTGNSKNDNYRVNGATATPTTAPTHTPTNTPTNTPTSTPTNTPTNTPTSTPTKTPTNTPTLNPSITPTVTSVASATPTSTATSTSTSTDTPTVTSSPEPQVTVQVIIPVTGADIHGGQLASSRLFLASIVSLGFGMVLSGMARKEEEI